MWHESEIRIFRPSCAERVSVVKDPRSLPARCCHCVCVYGLWI